MTEIERRLKKAEQSGKIKTSTQTERSAASSYSETSDTARRLRIAEEQNRKYSAPESNRRAAMQRKTESWMDFTTEAEPEARAAIDRYKATEDAKYYAAMNQRGATIGNDAMQERGFAGYKRAAAKWREGYHKGLNSKPVTEDTLDGAQRQQNYWAEAAKQAAQFGDQVRYNMAVQNVAKYQDDQYNLQMEEYERQKEEYEKNLDALRQSNPAEYYALTKSDDEIDRMIAYFDYEDKSNAGRSAYGVTRTPEEEARYLNNLRRARFAGESDAERAAYIRAEQERYEAASKSYENRRTVMDDTTGRTLRTVADDPHWVEYFDRTPEEQAEYLNNLRRARFVGESDAEREAYIQGEKDRYAEQLRNYQNGPDYSSNLATDMINADSNIKALELAKSIHELERVDKSPANIEAGRAALREQQGRLLTENKFYYDKKTMSRLATGAGPADSKDYQEMIDKGWVLYSDFYELPADQQNNVYAVAATDPEKAVSLAQHYLKLAEDEHYQKIHDWVNKDSGWQFGRRALGMVGGAAAKLASGLDPYGTMGQGMSKAGNALISGGAASASRNGLFGIEFLGGDESGISSDVPFIGKGQAGLSYQVGASVLQSVATAVPAIIAGNYSEVASKVAETIGLVLMGSSAAADDYTECIDRGMTVDQARLHATAAGVAEAAFERISLENLIHPELTTNALKRWLQQAGIEASEEVCTSIANRISDELLTDIYGVESDVDRRTRELVADGLSYNAARGKAENEWIADVIQDGMSGFLSGLIMGGGSEVIRSVANKGGKALNVVETRKEKTKAGAAVIRSEGSVEALQAYAKDNGIEIKAVETAEQNAGESAEQGNQDVKQNSYSNRDYRSISDTNSKVVQSIRSEVRGKTVQEQQTIRDNLVEKYGEGIAPVVNQAISVETAARVRQEYGSVDSIQAARNQAVSEIKDESLRQAVSDGYDSAAYALAASQGGEAGMNTMSRYIQQRKNTGSGAEMTMNATVTAQDGSTKTIAITGMSEDGKRVSLADGSEVAVKDLQADEDTTSAIQQLADLGLGADATKVLEAYQQSGVSGTDGYRWLMDYATAYNQGRTRQISLEQAAQRSSLDERTVMDAYTLGQQAANRETQAGLEKLKNLPKRKGASGRTANIDTTEIQGKTMSKSEMEQFELANQYAQAIGVDMVWFSSREQGGKYVGKNGAYENGKIYMDIHAGRNFTADLTSGILATMGHELTHFQQQYAPEEYQALKSFLFEQIAKSSPNGEARLERLIWEKQRRSGNTLSRKAAEDEVVADACQKMLRDSKAVHEFANQQPEAANGVIRWLDKWFKKVRSIFGRGGNYSEEAQIMDSLEQDVKAAFGELWDKALKQAAKVHDEVGNIEKATEESKAQNSDREDQSLRDRVSDLEERLELAEIDGLSQAEIRKLNNELIKARGQLDTYAANQRRQAKRTSFNEILRNLENYERVDLESLAEQISDSAWDDYDELSDEELIDALRETINERLEDFAPGEADDPKYGLFVKKPKTAGNISVVRYSDRDAEYLELAKDPEENAARLQEMVDEAAEQAGYTKVGDYYIKNSAVPGNTSITKRQQHFFELGRQFQEQYEAGKSVEDILHMLDDTDLENMANQESGSWERFFRAGLYGDTPKYRLAIRFGNIPDGKRSINWANHTYERGVSSVNWLDENTQNEKTLYDAIYGIQGIEKQIIGGWDFGIYGSDGEPLVVAPEKIADDAERSTIKLAKVTYDDAGNVIPLSERFNTENQDIRFSMREPVEQTDRLAKVNSVEGAQFSERDYSVDVDEKRNEPLTGQIGMFGQDSQNEAWTQPNLFDQTEQKKAKTGEELFLEEMDKFKKKLKKDGGWYGKEFDKFYAENPQMNFVERFYQNDPKTKADMGRFVAAIDDPKLLSDLSWYTTQSPMLKKGNYRGAVTKTRNVYKARINEIMAEKNNGHEIKLEHRKYSFDEVRGIFNKLNTNEAVGKLADKVFPVAKKLGLDIYATNKWYGERDAHAAGAYRGMDVFLRINAFADKGQSDQHKATTILHEMIHACTVYAIDEYMRGGYSRTINQNILKAVEMLDKVYGQARGEIPINAYYGMKNLKEFVAELANPKFREELSKHNLFERVLDAIKRFFGIDRVKGPSYLDSASAALDYLLDEIDYGEAARYFVKAENEAMLWERTTGENRYSERDYSTPSDEELLMNASVEDAESPEARAALQNSQKQARQIRDLTRRLERLQAEIRGYEGDSPNRISVQRFRQQALDLFGIPVGVRTDMGELLQSVAEGVLAGHNLSQDDIMYFFEMLITNGKEKIVSDETLAEIRDELKGRKIYVNEDVKAEFGDDWNAFRKRAFSLGIQLTNNEKNMGIDSVNLELAELYPGKFDADETDLRSILENIVDTAESGKTSNVPILDAMRETQKQTGEPVREQLQTMLDQFTRQIEIMQDQAAVERKARAGNAAEIAKARKQINESKEALREVRKQRDAWKRKSEGADARQKRALEAAMRNVIQHDAKQIAEAVRQKQALAQKLQDQIDREKKILSGELRSPELSKLLKAEREKAEARVKEQKEAQFARYKEGKKAGELRRRITRHSKELYGKLTKPSDKRHIPESYRGAVAALLNTINLESAYDIQEGTKNESGRGGKHVEKGTGTATNRTKAFQEVRKQLEKVLAEGGFTGELINNAAEGFDGGLIEKCQDFADKPISTLSSEELETLWNTIRALEHNITTFNKAFALAKTETISGLADSFLASAQKRKPLLKDPKSRLDLKIKKTSGAAMKALENPYTFFSHYGEEGIKLYRALRDTQDLEIVRTNNLSDLWVRKMADILGDEKTAKLNGDELTNAILDKIRDTSKQMDEKVETFKLENGQTITLTHAMLMDVYLLAQRGEVGMNHLLGSGLIQPEIRAKGKYVARDPSFRKLSLQDVQKLTGVITENATEKAIADAIQSMQHQLADWGNKASMDVFGYRKFTEDNYWPVKNAKEENKSDSGKGGNQPANVMNKGMAKNLVPNAATGMEPMSAFTKLQGSISDMLMYATWGPVMEDFKRFYNWKWFNPKGGTSDTVKGVMERYGGEGSQRYWEELRDQINNGIGNGKNIVDQFIGKAVGAVKGARVAYNLRVVVQQPTAYARAAEVISGKYLAASLLDIKSWGWKAKSAWNRALTHSPIAMRKDSTIYDMGGNISVGGEFGLDRPGRLDKARDFGTALAGKADAITWGRLWHAAELQISAKTNLEHGSQEYWDAVNKLFTEAVDRTQVVDGLLQRPAIMRTDSDFVKGATSYMGEPLMQLNMLMRQVNDFRQTGFKATKKQIGKTVTALVVTQLFNAMLTGLYDAGIRKEDEDKDFWERFVAEITGLDGTEENAWDYITSVWLESNATSEMSVMQKIPLLKDVLSMLQGYDPSNNRMDLEAIKDLIDVCTKVLWNDKYTPLYKAKEMINKASMIFGAGFGNALKDMYGVTRNIINDFGKTKARFDFKALWLNPASKKNKSQYFDLLFQMLENGDKDAFRQRAKKLAGQDGMLEFVAKGAIERYLTDGLSPADVWDMMEAAKDDGMSDEKFFDYAHGRMADAFRKRYFNHKLKDDQAITLLMQYSGKDEKDAWNTVRKWKDQAKHVGADGKLPDGYKWNQYDELKAEVATGNDISELIQTYKANGYSETQINGAIRDSIQEALTAGDLDEKEAADALIRYGVTYSKDGKTMVYDKQSAWKKVQEWADKAEHTDEEGELEEGYKYSAYSDLFEAVDANKNADGVIQAMVQKGGYDEDSLRGKIKDHLLERFIAGQITETALKNQLSHYCKISKADDANEIVANAKCKRDFGVYPDGLKEAFKEGDLSQNQAVKALQQYNGLSKTDAQNRVQYWGYDGDLSESAWLKWNNELKRSGLSVENWEKVSKVKSDAKGTDANGDGRADSGTVKAEVVSYIDSMNIPKSQKKAIYLAFGWAASTMPNWR